MTLIVEDWASLSSRELSLEAVKELHQPNERFIFRHAHQSYEPNVSTILSLYTRYLTRGSCRFEQYPQTEQGPVKVVAGQRISGPAEHVTIDVGPQGVDFILVVKIPE